MVLTFESVDETIRRVAIQMKPIEKNIPLVLLVFHYLRKTAKLEFSQPELHFL